MTIANTASSQTAMTEEDEMKNRAGESPLDSDVYADYVEILKEELIPATGCTEPIAVAYASAMAARYLEGEPRRCIAAISGSIIKNVNSVVVPNTGGLHGISAAIAAGAAAGDADAQLEVLAEVNEEGQALIRGFLDNCTITVDLADTQEPFFIDIRLLREGHSSHVVMEGGHTHISLVERDDEVVFNEDVADSSEDSNASWSSLNANDIITFADQVDLDDVREVLDRQIDYNYAIAQEGLRGDWGAQVGKTYLTSYDADDILVRAKANAAAGSDARMSGCPMPVVIISGSGNQGITASVPLVVYAREYGKSHDELLRALIVSDLVAIYQKTGIGCLSAFCGAVSAGVGAAAGIVYLLGGSREEIVHTIVNALGIISGMVCDGAKPSCAAKIAAALETGMFGYNLFKHGHEFYAGDGIVTKGVDRTIANVSRMAREGMRRTDREILNIMIGK